MMMWAPLWSGGGQYDLLHEAYDRHDRTRGERVLRWQLDLILWLRWSVGFKKHVICSLERAASIFHTKMSSLGTSKGILEIAKFALYVSVPITLMYSFAHNSEFLQKVIRNVRSPLSLIIFFCLNFHSLCEKSEAFDMDCLWHLLNLIANVVSWSSVVMLALETGNPFQIWVGIGCALDRNLLDVT